MGIYTVRFHYFLPKYTLRVYNLLCGYEIYISGTKYSFWVHYIRCVYKLNIVGTTYTLWVQNKYTLFTISTLIAPSQLIGGHAVREKR